MRTLSRPGAAVVLLGALLASCADPPPESTSANATERHDGAELVCDATQSLPFAGDPTTILEQGSVVTELRVGDHDAGEIAGLHQDQVTTAAEHLLGLPADSGPAAALARFDEGVVTLVQLTDREDGVAVDFTWLRGAVDDDDVGVVFAAGTTEIVASTQGFTVVGCGYPPTSGGSRSPNYGTLCTTPDSGSCTVTHQPLDRKSVV